MYRLRDMDIDDKVCEQVDMSMLSTVYPKEAIKTCVQDSQPWSTKARRVRESTVRALVLFVIAMALWSRLNQRQVWQKLVGKLSDLHPGQPNSALSASAISGRRQELRSQGLQTLMAQRCRLIAHPHTMPSAFFARYRLMAIDGTVFNTPDTDANSQALGRSSNQYGKGAYPQVRCVLLAECGSHAVVGLEIDGYDDAARAWGPPLAGSGGPRHAGAGGCRHHLGRVFGTRARATCACPWGFRSRCMGTSEPPTPTGRWLGAGMGGPNASRSGAVSCPSGDGGAHSLVSHHR